VTDSAGPIDLPPLRDVISRHGLRARKSLGQNFLLDLNLTARIARAAGALSDATVVEVGPGPGGLTRGLLAEGALKVIGIETDERAVAALAELEAAYPGRLTVIGDDALTVDEGQLISEYAAPSGTGVKVVANLPYNIATALLVKWLRASVWPPWFDGLTLMFQKEVAERIVAAPGSKAYGRLSVLAQWRCRATRHFDIPPSAFVPRPKVTSTVVGLQPLAQPIADARMGDLEAVTAAAFGQRRKMLRGSLKSLRFDCGGSVEQILGEADILPTRRAEELSVEQFCDLARAYGAVGAN
jgi:16S rRNA (adenine1518-N6/adenine1519-N6)-dimethyltransferase